MSELKPASIITWTLRSANFKYWFTTSFLQNRVRSCVKVEVAVLGFPS